MIIQTRLSATLGMILIALGSFVLASRSGALPLMGDDKDHLAAGTLPGLSGTGPLLLAEANGGTPTGKAVFVAGLGVVEPASGSIDLSPGTAGILASVNVDEGDKVRRGQLLAALLNDDLKAKVAQAEATLRIKTAQRDVVERGPRQEEIRQAEARLRQQESTLQLAEAQHKRRKALLDKGVLSRDDYNQAESTLATGREGRNEAQQALAELVVGSRPEDIEAARGEVALAQSQLDEARATLVLSEVRATVDGIVLRRYRQAGEVITAQVEAPVLQIADVSRLVVRTQIDEADFARVAVGQKALISAPGLGETSRAGIVQRISPRLGAKTLTANDPAEKLDTRVLDVIVSLPPGDSLPINLRVDVVIDVSGPGTSSTMLQKTTDREVAMAERDLGRHGGSSVPDEDRPAQSEPIATGSMHKFVLGENVVLRGSLSMDR